MAKVEKIFGSVQAIGEAPCDECQQAQRCAAERLACKQYASFVEDGVVRGGERSPTRRVYQQVYYGSLESSWEESREIDPRNDKGSPGERIQITFRRKTA